MNIEVSPKQMNYMLLSLRHYLKHLGERDDDEFGDGYSGIMAIESITKKLEVIQKQNIKAI